MSPKSELPPLIRRFVENLGSATQSFGLGRNIGQIYAYLFFSPEARNLADLQNALGISKGSASTNVRQLEQWGAVRRTWIKGDRKDYYEANDCFDRILKRVLVDTVGKKIEDYATTLEEGETLFETELVPDDRGHEFLEERLARLQKFRDYIYDVWQNPLVRKLLQ